MILATDRLLLREFVEKDWRAVLAYQSDRRYPKYYRRTHRTAEQVRDFVHGFIEWQGERPRTKYADFRRANIGYEIAPAYWAKGYATEAARAILAFGFGELRLHRIWARCVAENVASYQVLEQVGMRREGRLREEEWMKGRWWDILVYGILDYEWRSQA
jgi:RimJ/RimL family protein N-acetyltransferase